MKADLKAQADAENKLNIAERDKLISDLKTQLDEVRRKTEQRSQQLQGEVLELDFEQKLRAAFPEDEITPIAKGVRGADIIQAVVTKAGRTCGKMLHETKRTKNWNESWISKLKEDMHKAGAAIGIIVTEVMPNGSDCFFQRDDIWVTDIKSAIPLTEVLRCILLKVAIAHGYREGAKEKMELLYEYLTGTGFRQRVRAIVEKVMSMRSALDKERASASKAWSIRETQITAITENMAGIIGDLQGLSGNALQDIPALELEG
jgi:hypothetical protein